MFSSTRQTQSPIGQGDYKPTTIGQTHLYSHAPNTSPDKYSLDPTSLPTRTSSMPTMIEAQEASSSRLAPMRSFTTQPDIEQYPSSSTKSDKSSKIKRAFGALKRTPEPGPSQSSSATSNPLGKLLNPSTSSLHQTTINSDNRPTGRSNNPLALQIPSVFGSKKSTAPLSPPPPDVPPKSARHQPLNLPPASQNPPPSSLKPISRIDPRGSIMPATAGMAAALQYIREYDLTGTPPPPPHVPESKRSPVANPTPSPLKVDSSSSTKQDRPVSIADSIVSTHTIVPEKDPNAQFTRDDSVSQPTPPLARAVESTPNKPQRKRSRSLPRQAKQAMISDPILIPQSHSRSQASPFPDYSPYSQPEYSFSKPILTQSPLASSSGSSDMLTLPTNVSREPSPTPSNRSKTESPGRFATWKPESPSAKLSRPTWAPHERHTPSPAENVPESYAPPPSKPQQSSSSSPFATGFAKRTMEKMGRAFGGVGASVVHGVTSSTSSSPPSNDKTLTKLLGKKVNHTTSNSWSMGSRRSSLSNSDSGQPMSMLGRQIRAPLQPHGGLVFGRDLRTCVNMTAVGRYADSHTTTRLRDGSLNPEKMLLDDAALEARRLPALVVRCTQHILAWGIKEEGLFRVSGRASHVATLRSEFDNGADFDIYQCSLSDLDPHAVSSIFKAYLRELPEPILTNNMMPYFEAAMLSETKAAKQDRSLAPPGETNPPPSMNAETLPTIRKAPSLTTLGIPTFTQRAPSEGLVQAFRTLIRALPLENRHLMQTVTELICATAERSQLTKMPMSNLLLVFCPSLHMNPPLLRALCEAKGIWEDEEEEVMDISATPAEDEAKLQKQKSREAVVLEGKPTVPPRPDRPVTPEAVLEPPRMPSSEKLGHRLNSSLPAIPVTAAAIDPKVERPGSNDGTMNRPQPTRSQSTLSDAPLYARRPLPAPPEARPGSSKSTVSNEVAPLPEEETIAAAVALPAEDETPSEQLLVSVESERSSSPPQRSPPSLSSSSDSVTSLSAHSSKHDLSNESDSEPTYSLSTSPVIVDPANSDSEGYLDPLLVDPQRDVATTEPSSPRKKQPSLQNLLRRSVGSLKSLGSPTPRSPRELVNPESYRALGYDLEADVADDFEDRRHTMKPIDDSEEDYGQVQEQQSYLPPPPALKSFPSQQSLSIDLDTSFGDDWAQSVLAAASSSTN